MITNNINTEKLIDDSLFEIGKEFLRKKKKKPFIPLFVILAGIALAILIGNIMPKYTFSNVAMMSGYMISVSGLALFITNIRNKGVAYSIKTGKGLRRYEYLFNQNQRKNIIECINAGNCKLLENLPKGNPSSIKVIIYKTQEEDLVFMQALEHIPEAYHPITDIKIVQKGTINN